MIQYTVRVYDNGAEAWFLNDELHCEHGPAIKHANGDGSWYLNGFKLTEAGFNRRMSKPCSGKVVEVEGVKYRLEEVV